MKIAGASSPTLDICRYVTSTEYDSIPEDVRDLAKLFILDSIACMVGGSTLPPSRIATGVFSAMGGVPESTVWGTDRRLPVLHAAYLNSAFANAMDFDDTESGHPGATVIPPALSIAEATRVTGKQLILAIVLGYEVGLRVVSAIRPSTERWRIVAASSTPQTFGTVAAASRLLELSLGQTVVAFGLAGSTAPVPAIRKFGTLDAGPISWLKNNYGAASWSGVLAAQLAARDFVGPRTILDGERGFWIMAGSDQCDFDELTRVLGQEYRMRQVSFKPYPCCRYLHAAIDAVRSIHTQHDFDISQVRSIQVASIKHLTTFLNYEPRNPFDIQFSLPYVLALTVAGIPPGYAWQSTQNLENPELAALARKVEAVVDIEAEREFVAGQPFETGVTILADSDLYEERVTFPSGHPRNPLGQEALYQKFHRLVDPILGEERATRLRDYVTNLEAYASVSPLFEPARE